ncbi:MAG: lipopolysaccharide biosynthesis protein [Gemmatimonadaceae bacterium]
MGGIAGASARLISVGTAIISVPLTLQYLGVERYGLWLTISSAVTIMGFADLGLNNGIISLLAEAHGRDDEPTARMYVSSAFVMLTGIALLLGASFWAAYPFVHWAHLFNVSSPLASREAGPAVAAFTVCFLLNIPLALADRAQMAYQETFMASMWQAAGSVVGLIAILIAIWLHAGLPWLVIAIAGAPAAATLLNNVDMFGRRYRWLRPRLRSATWIVMKKLAASGMLYFTLQAVGAFAYQADTLVIAHFLGAGEVPQYAVPLRLFMFVPVILSLVLRPLWPAYADAIARREAAWVRRTFLRITRVVLSFTVPVTLVLVLFGTKIIHLWVGNSITPSLILLVGCALWGVVTGLTESLAMLYNGANIIGYQVVSATIMGAANLGLSIYLVQRIGVSGPLYGSLIAVLLFTLTPAAFYVPRMFRSWAAQHARAASTA